MDRGGGGQNKRGTHTVHTNTQTFANKTSETFSKKKKKPTKKKKLQQSMHNNSYRGQHRRGKERLLKEQNTGEEDLKLYQDIKN